MSRSMSAMPTKAEDPPLTFDDSGLDYDGETLREILDEDNCRRIYELIKEQVDSKDPTLGGLGHSGDVENVLRVVNLDLADMNEKGRGSMDMKLYNEIVFAVQKAKENLVPYMDEDGVEVRIRAVMPKDTVISDKINADREKDREKRMKKGKHVALLEEVNTLMGNDPVLFCVMTVTKTEEMVIRGRHLVSNLDRMKKGMPIRVVMKAAGLKRKLAAGKTGEEDMFYSIEHLIQATKVAVMQNKEEVNIKSPAVKVAELLEMGINLTSMMPAGNVNTPRATLDFAYEKLNEYMVEKDLQNRPLDVKKAGGQIPMDASFFDETAGSNTFDETPRSFVIKTPSEEDPAVLEDTTVHIPQCALFDSNTDNLPLNVGMQTVGVVWRQLTDIQFKLFCHMMIRWNVKILECLDNFDTTWNGCTETGPYDNVFGVLQLKKKQYKNHFGRGYFLGALFVNQHVDSSGKEVDPKANEAWLDQVVEEYMAPPIAKCLKRKAGKGGSGYPPEAAAAVAAAHALEAAAAAEEAAVSSSKKAKMDA